MTLIKTLLFRRGAEFESRHPDGLGRDEQPRSDPVLPPEVVGRREEPLRPQRRQLRDLHRREPGAEPSRRHQERATVHDRPQELPDQER